jgi:hypothetical protein
VQQILAFSRQTEHERTPMQVHLLGKISANPVPPS